jgi:hypothetical protein
MFSKFEILRDLAILKLVLETAQTKSRALLAHISIGSSAANAVLRTSDTLFECSTEHARLSAALNEANSDAATIGDEVATLHIELGAVFMEIEFLFDELKAMRLPLPTPLHRYQQAA